MRTIYASMCLRTCLILNGTCGSGSRRIATKPLLPLILVMMNTELFTIPFDGKFVVYAPLRKAAFITNAHTVNMISRLKDSECTINSAEEELLQFLRLIGVWDNRDDFTVLTNENDPLKPTSVTLFLSSACNLRCVYCYAESAQQTGANMVFQTAKAGIDFVCRNARETRNSNFQVIYHGGGEFTQNWKVLVESVRYARFLEKEMHMEAAISGASNGVFSDKQCQWLVRNLQGLSISVDGLPEIHDIHRPLVSGGPSSKLVFNTLNSFTKAGFPYSIRMTVTPNAVDRLPKSVGYLLNHASPTQIVVEPVYNLGRGKKIDLFLDPKSFVSAFRKSNTVANKYGIPLLYSAARIDLLTKQFCNAGDGNFCITPSGKISVCYQVTDEHTPFSDEFLVGNYDMIKEKFIFDEEKIRRIKRWNVQSTDWCRECFAKWHCAGDCPNLVRHAMVSGKFKGHSRCEITRALLFDQILEKIEKSDGFLWSERLWE